MLLNEGSTIRTVSLCFKKLPNSEKSQVYHSIYEMTFCIRKGESKYLLVFDRETLGR